MRTVMGRPRRGCAVKPFSVGIPVINSSKGSPSWASKVLRKDLAVYRKRTLAQTRSDTLTHGQSAAHSSFGNLS